jgi:hypothetical protein
LIMACGITPANASEANALPGIITDQRQLLLPPGDN